MSFWSVFSYSVQCQWTISWSNYDMWWEMDFIWQLTMVSSVTGPRRSSKALPKEKFAPNKESWSLFGSLLLVWTTTALWILVKPLHLRSTLSKSMRSTKSCSAYNRYWLIDVVSRKAPVLLHDSAQSHVAQPILQKLNKLGSEVLPHLPCSPDLLPADYHFRHLNNFIYFFHLFLLVGG